MGYPTATPVLTSPNAIVTGATKTRSTRSKWTASIGALAILLSVSSCGKSNPLIGKWFGNTDGGDHAWDTNFTFKADMMEVDQPTFLNGNGSAAVQYKRDGDYEFVFPKVDGAQSLKFKIVDSDHIMLIDEGTSSIRKKDVGVTFKRVS